MALADSTSITATSVVFSALAIFLVLLRFRARRNQGSKVGADDYLIVAGLSDFATQLLSILALTFTKLSIVFFYRRIFHDQRFRLVTAALIAAICVWGTSFFLATLLECIPVSAVWDLHNGEPGHMAKCYNPIPMFYGIAISNMLMSSSNYSHGKACLTCTPTVPTKQKAAVAGVFLLGAFVTGISIARVYFFFQAGQQLEQSADAPRQDGQDERAPATLYWTQLEASIAVACACLPTLRALFGGPGPGFETAVRTFASRFSLASKSSLRDLRRAGRDPQEGPGAGGDAEAVSLPGWEIRPDGLPKLPVVESRVGEAEGKGAGL
ncbi:hypothetical protein F4780DRAFT_779206 [Xylariomycetidae sp. FL0641]|nr:hypothetical protein F4780DRAFT_779206 [Xylariomycetidae sp. FL0641]